MLSQACKQSLDLQSCMQCERGEALPRSLLALGCCLKAGAGPEPRQLQQIRGGLRCKIETLRGSRCLLWTAVSDLVKLDPKPQRYSKLSCRLSSASSCILSHGSGRSLQLARREGSLVAGADC